MPREVPDVWGNVGTVQTCSAQGFFEQFGVSTVMYSASLSVYYLITIRGGRSAGSRARIRRMEPALHAVPLVFGLATAVASLALNLFNYGLWDCWIAPYPGVQRVVAERRNDRLRPREQRESVSVDFRSYSKVDLHLNRHG